MDDPAREKSLGTLLDKALRKVNALQLVDYYMGSRVDYPGSRVGLFFSEGVPTDQLRELQADLATGDIDVDLAETDEEGAAWYLSIGLEITPGATKVPFSGRVPIAAKVQGTVGVSAGGVE